MQSAMVHQLKPWECDMLILAVCYLMRSVSACCSIFCRDYKAFFFSGFGFFFPILFFLQLFPH